jgi:hypothetical protein
MTFITGNIMLQWFLAYCRFYEIGQVRVTTTTPQRSFQIDLFV